MFRKELIALGVVAAAVFLVVAGIALWAVRIVQYDASMVARDTLPGLENAGAAIIRLHENWFNTYRLLSVDSPETRIQLMNGIETNSTGEMWGRYSESIYDERDAQLFQAVENARADYLKARSNFFNLVRSSSMTDARDFLSGKLDSAHQKYSHAAADLFTFNAEIGQQRSNRIMHLSPSTPYLLGALGVVVLLAGVFVGFKASLGTFSLVQNDYSKLTE